MCYGVNHGQSKATRCHHTDGSSHGHSHSHGGGDSCVDIEIPHVYRNKKAIMERLADVAAQLETSRRMVDNDLECSDVLLQLARVKADLNEIGAVLMQTYISECIPRVVKAHDTEKLEALNTAIGQFVK